MKNLILILAIFILCNCTESDIPEVDSIFELSIIPSNPSPTNEIKIVHKHCNYENFKKLEIIQNVVNYSREFNSSLMIPCKITNDTLTIGKLPKGEYKLIYELIDKSEEILSSDSVSFKEELLFEVL